jgi:hypothetical protein
MVSRSIAAALLAAALTLGLRGRLAPRARADGPEFTPLCGPFVSPVGENVQWGPGALQKLQEEFVIESGRYIPEEHRYTWVLRSQHAFPGNLEDAEKLLEKRMDASMNKKAFCAFFYDPTGRKMGTGVVYLLIGERRPDNSFTVFADLSVLNVDLVATRAVITLGTCVPPMPQFPDKEGAKNGSKEGKKDL